MAAQIEPWKGRVGETLEQRVELAISDVVLIQELNVGDNSPAALRRFVDNAGRAGTLGNPSVSATHLTESWA